jgi:hypothetical protein
MSTIEERLRDGLRAEVPVSADAMIDAAVAGVRRHRRRRTTGIVTGAVAAVTLAVVAGVTLAGGGSQQPQPPKPIETPKEKVSTPPSSASWFDDLETDGTTLYVTTHRCPTAVRAGRCEIRDGFWNGRPPAAKKAYAVTLLRRPVGTPRTPGRQLLRRPRGAPGWGHVRSPRP